MLLGIDTGGTFTDFVLLDGQDIRIHKVLSTPDFPEHAILQGIKDLNIDLDAPDNDLYIIHGSTVGTNAVLEGKGVKTAFVTNKGFRDLLSLGRQTRRELYNLCPEPVTAPVPEVLCFEIDARLAADGSEITEISEESLICLRKQLENSQVQSVAINLLFSFINDEHEKVIESIVPEGLFISRSSAVLPEYKEYERGMATWLNAWVGPIMARYLSRLNHAVKDTRLSVMQSSGGTIAADQAGEQAVHLLLSGPAGGMAGAQHMAGCSGYDQLLTFDMGGTSTDVALIDGELTLSSEGFIGPYPVAVPMVDMHTIGAGGGSIAYIDEGGLLHVGPESAGADPGPACYGRGGKHPTVTDANLLLGRLRADAFLGGSMALNYEAARTAVVALAEQLNLTVEETAQGIVKVVNENMARALRVMSVQRGIEPSQLTLVSFGGAGGLHVCALAQSLKINRAVIPVNAGVLSALGMIVAPKVRLLSRSIIGLLEHYQRQQLEQYFSQMCVQGCAALKQEGVADSAIKIEKSVDLRYHGQSYYLNIKWPEQESDEAVFMKLNENFHEMHQRYYGHSLTQAIELVNIRIKLSGPHTTLPLQHNIKSVIRAKAGTVQSDEETTGVVARESLQVNDVVHGPALITETVSTTYLAIGWQCRVDETGNMILLGDSN